MSEDKKNIQERITYEAGEDATQEKMEQSMVSLYLHILHGYLYLNKRI